MTTADLIAERMRLAKRAREIQETALAECRDLDAAETKEFTDCMARVKEITSEIERRCASSR